MPNSDTGGVPPTPIIFLSGLNGTDGKDIGITLSSKILVIYRWFDHFWFLLNMDLYSRIHIYFLSFYLDIYYFNLEVQFNTEPVSTKMKKCADIMAN